MAYSGFVFPFQHNWDKDVIERLSWQTSMVGPHRNASEQRVQVRLDPRRLLEYSVLGTTPQLRARLDLVRRHAQEGNGVMLPIWTDASRLQTAAASGQPVITVPTTYYDYDVGGYLMLWRSEISYEFIKIQSLTSSTVTVDTNLVSTWPAGKTVVAPARLAFIRQSIRGSQIAYDVVPYTFLFDVDEASHSTNRITAISPDTYISRDVFTGTGESSEDFERSSDYKANITDAQTGLVSFEALGLGAQDLITVPRLFLNRQEISQWWGFLDRRQGRRIPFWTPSWERDFIPTDIAASLTGYITYEPTGYPSLTGIVQGRRDIAIIYERDGAVFPRGTQKYKRIQGVFDSGGVEKILVNLESISPTDVDKVKIAFLRYVRLESDTQEFAWKTTCALSSRPTFREIVNTPA